MACRAMFGVGYILSAEEAKPLLDNEDWEDELVPLNCYTDDTDYFFGEVLDVCDPGEYCEPYIPSSLCEHTDKVEAKYSPAIPHIDRYAKTFLLSVWD